MKKFSQQGKEWIKQICEAEEGVKIADLLPMPEGFGFARPNSGQSRVILYVPLLNTSDGRSFHLKLRNLQNIIQYLEDNEMILSHREPGVSSVEIINARSGKLVTIQLQDIVYKWLNDNEFSVFHKTDALVDLYEHDFQTPEERQLKAANSRTWAAIGVTAVMSLASLIQNCSNADRQANYLRQNVYQDTQTLEQLERIADSLEKRQAEPEIAPPK